VSTIFQVTSQPGAVPTSTCLGWWIGDLSELRADDGAIREAISDLRHPVTIVKREGAYAIASTGTTFFGPPEAPGTEALPVAGYVPPIFVRQLGDPTFLADHGIRFPYMTGAMANGIASVELVEAIGQAGILGSFGAAGLSLQQIEQAIDRLQACLGNTPYAINLIHSPNEPEHERAVVELYLRRNIRLVEASAYLDLTPHVVRYRVHGIHTDPNGHIVTPNRIIAKASRVEVATKWFSPPPERLLAQLLEKQQITAQQAKLAAQIPMAQDLTAEADSGGHTDNRPAITLLPTLLALRDRLQAQHRYTLSLRVGAAGGIATPASAAAAFAMGAAFLVTGSVNQACIESGSSDDVRKMLAQTQQADVIMAPAADMFEMGVKLQVLKRGTLFAMRAAKLFELYRTYDSIEQIPTSIRQQIEKTIFRAPLETIWQETRSFFLAREPGQVRRAESDPKHKMALLFRWYLGLSSRWANRGDTTRQADYQVWCGPAMGAFNEWTKGSFLEQPKNRRVVSVAFNILYGAAVTTRVNGLRSQGVRLSPQASRIMPQRTEQLQRYLVS